MTGELYPNGAICVTDDRQILDYLAQQGHLDKVAEIPGKNFVGWCTATANAWLFFSHDYGHRDGDNGYTLLIMPKHLISHAEANRIITGFVPMHAPDAVYAEQPQAMNN